MSTPPREASRLVASAGPTRSVDANTVAIDTQAQAMPKSSLKTLKSPERGSFINCRSTMLIITRRNESMVVWLMQASRCDDEFVSHAATAVALETLLC